jgi:hypothetical protein
MLPLKIIHPDYLSCTSIFVEINWGDKQISIATGFFWKIEKNYSFITNYHVVSGLHPETGQPLDINGSTPDNLNIWLRLKDNLDSCEPFNIPLFDNQSRPKWKEHNSLGSKIDVISMSLDVPEKYRIYPVNEYDYTNFRLEVSQDVFIIGYPKGLYSTFHLPIWKRGSIASEPDLNLDDLPKLMVDSATREGMSGSPVIAQFSGNFSHDPSSPQLEDWFGRGRKFLGIYSGRMKAENEFEAQLGYVWKAPAIRDIVNEGVRPQ